MFSRSWWLTRRSGHGRRSFLTKGSTSPSVASGATIPSNTSWRPNRGLRASPTLRIAALARIRSEYDPDDPPEKAIRVEPVSEVADGLTWAELKADPVLSQSEPVRSNGRGTLFALTTAEAQRILELFRSHATRTSV